MFNKWNNANNVLIYNMLREVVPNWNGRYLGKRIQVVITFGMRDKLGQGMLVFSPS